MKTKNILPQFLISMIALGIFLYIPKAAQAAYGVSVSYSDGYSRGDGRHGGGHGGWHGGGHGRHWNHHNHNWIGFNYYNPGPYYPYYPGRVYSIPRAAKFVWYGGERYYYYGGLYYQPSPDGAYYTIVDDPYQRPQVTNTTINNIYQGSSQAANDTTAADGSEFDVNFPNSKGEMVTVKIKKSGNGYVGPQGEFYPEFPKVAQLKEMYTK
ncbi:MAG: hypothetical protein KBD53_02700 [Candidatus Omnitrophica bacterium]|nr:hypothetical protein [Candidatus Omnitrophota bacterium]